MMRGFTLLEVVIALLILEIGVLGVMGTLLLASRALGDAEIRERAVLEALRVSDSLAVGGAAGAGTRVLPWGRVTWTEAGEDRPGRVVAVGGGGDTLVALQRPGAP